MKFTMKKKSISILAAVVISFIATANSAAAQTPSNSSLKYTIYCTPDFSSYAGKTKKVVEADLAKAGVQTMPDAPGLNQLSSNTFYVPLAEGTEVLLNPPKKSVLKGLFSKAKKNMIGAGISHAVGTAAGAALGAIPGGSGVAGAVVNSAGQMAVGTATVAGTNMAAAATMGGDVKFKPEPNGACQTVGSSAIGDMYAFDFNRVSADDLTLYQSSVSPPLFQTDIGRVLLDPDNLKTDLTTKVWIWQCYANFTNPKNTLHDVRCSPFDKAAADSIMAGAEAAVEMQKKMMKGMK